MKTVSVCLACCNGEKFIEKQITSIIDQLGPNDEFIVVDDGSSDRTVNIVESFGSRIRFVQNEKQLGVYRNFEKAISLCKNEYIFLADQDDIWEPNKVEVLSRLLERSDVVSSNCNLIDSNDTPIGIQYSDLRHPHTTFIGNFWKMGHLGCCMAFRRSLLSRCLPFPGSDDYITHDMWILLSGTWFGKKFSYESKPLIKYRRHSSNVSSGGHKTDNSLSKILLIRIYLIMHLVSRSLTLWRPNS